MHGPHFKSDRAPLEARFAPGDAFGWSCSMGREHLQNWTRIGAMNRDADNVGQASRLPVRAASLPPKCSTGKDVRRTGSQDGYPTLTLPGGGGFQRARATEKPRA